MIIQNFDLNLIPNSAPVVVHCDQYDRGTGRLVISLYEGSVAYSPSGTAVIQGRKPDGKGFNYNCTLSGNVVTADLTEQMTAVAGQVRTQIVVTESTGRTGTFVFILDVQSSALPADTDMSESDYQMIEQAIEAAQDAVEDSSAWAIGERGGVPVSPTDETYHNNSKYWAEMAAQYAQGGVIFRGSVAFASIPVTGMSNGDMYNITNDFTTDSRFIEGAGKECAAGTNIVWIEDVEKWDILAMSKIGSLDDLNDVNISSPTNGQGLLYNSTTQEWENTNIPSGGASDLDDLTDVDISSPTNNQVLTYNSTTQKWENANAQGGGGDYVGLYGMTEIQSSDGQGSTLIDLDTYTSVGNYYCNGKGRIQPRYNFFDNNQSGGQSRDFPDAVFVLVVKKLPNNNLTQELTICTDTNQTSAFFRLIRYKGISGWTYWARQGSTTAYGIYLNMNQIYDTSLSSLATGDLLVYNNTNLKWENKPVLKVTSKQVATTGWTSDTTSQSGTTLYKKTISLSHVYVTSPIVDIGASGVLPTTAQQEAYDLLSYVTINGTTLTLYGTAIPSTSYYINITGAD